MDKASQQLVSLRPNAGIQGRVMVGHRHIGGAFDFAISLFVAAQPPSNGQVGSPIHLYRRGLSPWATDCIVHWKAVGHCSFHTELNHQRVQSMLDSGQVYILASNADLSKHDIPDHGGKFVEHMSTSDIDLLGIVCVDISRMSAMPKPIWVH